MYTKRILPIGLSLLLALNSVICVPLLQAPADPPSEIHEFTELLQDVEKSENPTVQSKLLCLFLLKPLLSMFQQPPPMIPLNLPGMTTARPTGEAPAEGTDPAAPGAPAPAPAAAGAEKPAEGGDKKPEEGDKKEEEGDKKEEDGDKKEEDGDKDEEKKEE